MSFCSTIYGNLPDSGFVYTATSVSVDNGSFENLSATNATIVNLETTTFNPTNVDCTNLTADNATITDITATNATIDNLEVTNFDITTLEATTANISTINSSIINSSHSNLSTIGTFRINISEASDPALASVIRRDANNLLFEGRVDPTDPHATIIFFSTEEGAGYGPTLQMNLSNVDIRNVSGDKLTYTNASIDNLSATDIEASGAIDAFSVEASLLTATSNLQTPFVNTSDLQTQLINSSQINASNISTRNLSAVLQITSTYIDATNRMTTPTLNSLVNNVSIVNASTINSQTGNFTTANISTSNISTSNIQTILNIKDNVATNNDSTIQKTSGNLKLSVDGTQADIDIYTGGLVYIPTELDTTLMTALTANITTGNISTLNVSNMNVCTKNANILNASTINCSNLVADGTIDAFSVEGTLLTATSNLATPFVNTSAMDTQLINCSQINASDIDANTIDADTITGDISPNLAAGTGISLSTAAGITTISNTGSITDPLNLTKLNVSNISCDNTIESAISKAIIFELKDGSGGGGASGIISETSNVMTLFTGAAGGVIEFGTTYGGNFSVQIANDALNASTANISQANASNMSLINLSADLITGNIGANLAAGTGISLSTAGGITTISNTGGSVTDPLNISVINLSTLNGLTTNISHVNASTITADTITGDISPNLTAGTGITLSTASGVTTISNPSLPISNDVLGRSMFSFGGGGFNVTTSFTSLWTSFVTPSSADTNLARSYIVKEGSSQLSVTFDVACYEISGFGADEYLSRLRYRYYNGTSWTGWAVCTNEGRDRWRDGEYRGGQLFPITAVITTNASMVNNPIQFEAQAGRGSGDDTFNLQQRGAGNFNVFTFEVTESRLYNGTPSNSYTNPSTAVTLGSLTTPLLNATTGNISTLNSSTFTADTITGDISPNLTAGTGISLSTTGGVTTITNTAGVTNPLNVSNSNISNLTIDNNLNGYAFIRTIAIAKVLANGINVKTIGCTISRSATGRYGCVLDVARPSSDYCVQLTSMEDNATLDDCIIQLTQGSMTTTGFLYVITEQDNGTSPGTYRDRNHFVTVFDTD